MAVTVKVPAEPTVKVVALAEVMVGDRVAGHREREALGGVGRMPLAAVMVIG